MAKNWYTRLLKNIIGRTSNDVSSKGELRLKRLEDRRLLNADFALAGGDLALSNFDGTDVVVGDAGVAFTFTLDAGDTWTNVGGVDPNAIAVLNVLTVNKAAFNAAGGSINIDDMGLSGADVNVSINDVDFAAAGANSLNVIIENAGNISDGGAGEVTVDGTLSMMNVGNVILDNVTNDFESVVTISDASSVTINAVDDLNIGGITTDDGAISITTNDQDGDPNIHSANISVNGLISSIGGAVGGGDGAITITADGDLTLDLNNDFGTGADADAIVSGEGTTTLTANGNITQDADGAIDADNLVVIQDSATGGDVTLQEGNDVQVIAARNDFATGSISFHSTENLSIDLINGLSGVTTNNGTIDLQSDMSLTVDSDDAQELFNSNGGNVNLFAGIDVVIIDASMDGLDVGAVNFLISEDSALNVDVAISTTGILRLQADGNITQSEVITASTLAAQQLSPTTGAITLNGDNVVNNFAASNAFDTGAISFNNTLDLTIGSVAAVAAAGVRPTFTATAGVTSTNGLVTLSSNNALILNNNVNAGTNDVRLTAEDEINQTGGIITANEVSARVTDSVAPAGNEAINLGLANAVDEFVADNDSAGGAIIFNSVRALSVGTFDGLTGVSSTDGDITITTDDGVAGTHASNITVDGLISSIGAGADASDGTVTLTADGTLTLNEDVTAGQGDVRLTAEDTISQNADDLITANEVAARVLDTNAVGNQNISLGLANVVDEFVADNDSVGGTITFNSVSDLTIGTFDSLNGVTSTNGLVTLSSGNALTLANNVNAGTNDVILTADDEINQTAGIITANEVAARVTDTVLGTDGNEGITLALDNAVDEFVANNASAGGAISFHSVSDLSIGTFDSLNGVTSTDNGVGPFTNDITLTSDNALTLDNNVNAGSADVRLTADDEINQTAGIITANQVSARVTDLAVSDGDENITLNQANAVDEFVADNDSAGGAVTFQSTRDLTIGTFDGLMGISTTDDAAAPFSNNITVNGDGTLSLTQAVNAGSANVNLTSGATMSQSGSGIITGATLTANKGSSTADISLGLVNAVDTFVASNDFVLGSITFHNGQALSVGNVTTLDGEITITTDDGNAVTNTADISVNGLVTSIGAMADIVDGEISISADGALSLDFDPVTTGMGTNTVINSGMAITRLEANGSITQDTDGLITAATLGVRQDSATAGFNINLCEANIVGTFAANNASDGFISFQSTQSFSTGSVSAIIGPGNTNGVTSQGGFIELQSGGTLTIAAASPVSANGGDVSLLGATDVVLNAALNTGAGDILIVDGGALNINQDLTSTNSIRLQAGGAVTQTAGSIISAGELGVRQTAVGANIDIILSDDNTVDQFAATNASLGGQIEFLTLNNLTIGNVTAGTGKGAVFTAVNGVSTTAFAGQTASLTDTDDRGDILVETRGSLTLAVDGMIDATTGVVGQVTAVSAAGGLSDARLIADGAIAQDQDGLIVADELGVRLQSDVNAVATEAISLGFGNSVNEISVVNTSAGGAITFQNNQTLSVGSVAEQAAANGNIDFTATIGVSSIDGDITITTDDGVALTNTANINVNALVSSIGAGADGNDGAILISADGAMTLDLDRSFDGLMAGTAVNSGDAITRLVSNGSITQDTDGLITADTLGVRQNSTAPGANINLCEANVIDNVFATNNASTTGFISFQSTQSFTTGSVPAVTGFAITNGVTTQGGNLELQSGGTLTIAAASPVNANGGDVSLLGATDVVLNAALNTGAGDILIVDGGALTINQDLTSTSSIRLQAGGAVTQTAGSIISAGELGVRQTAIGANIDINLSDDNTIDQFAATNASVGGQIEFLTLNDLTIGNVTASSGKGAVFTAVNGVSTTAFVGQTASLTDIDDRGDILIETRGSLTLAVDEAIDATTGIAGQVNAISAASGLSDARLIADGVITQDTDGLIVADELGVRLQSDVDVAANENIAFGQANTVNEVAALNTSVGGTVTFQSVNNLTVGVVAEQNAANANIDFTSTAGVLSTNIMANTTNDILIEAGGFLNLDEAVNTDATATTFDADVRLIANGDISQDAEGVITANELGVLQRQAVHNVAQNLTGDVDTQHDVDLGFENNVDEVAINNAETGAEINFKSTRDLTVGSVAAQVVQGANFELTPAGNDAVTGVVSTSATGNTTNEITIEADGFLNLDEVVNTDRNTTGFKADVRLLASGDISQDAGGLITANELGVLQRQAAHDNADDIGANDSQHDVDLGEANDVDEVAIHNTEVGAEVNFRSTQNLTVGAVAAKEIQGIDFESPTAADTALEGVVSTSSAIDTANEITIQADGSLNLTETVNTDRNGTTFVSDVRLVGNGDISQTSAGIIIADELGVVQNRVTHEALNDIVTGDTQHDVDLCEDNQVNEVAIINVEPDAEIGFHSVNNLVLGTVTEKEVQTIDFQAPAPAPANTDVVGVVSAEGDISVTTDGALTVNDSVNSIGADDSAGDGNILLQADGSVTINAAVDAGFIATMITGDVQINSGSFLDISDDIDGNNVRLQGSGEIIQSDGDIISANALAARQVGTVYNAADDVDPDSTNSTFDIVLGFDNVVSLFAADNDFNGGQITFHTTENLTIGSLAEVTASGKNSGFATTTGVITTLGLLSSLDLDNDGDDTFDITDGSLGDILIDSEQSLSINEVIRAGNLIGEGSAADVRLVASGDIRQNMSGTITADELGVRQISGAFSGGADVSGNGNFDIDLLSDNDVLLVTLSNAIAEGNINFRDMNNLSINAMTGSMIQNADFDQTVGIVANGGNIFVEAQNNLTVLGVSANSREIISVDGMVDNSNMAPAPEGESITFTTVDGNITLGQNVIITTDEDTTALASSPTTNDMIIIDANEVSGGIVGGTVTISAGVQIRTDGGVAIQFGNTRPDSAGSDATSAFFQGGPNPVPASLSPKTLDGGLTTQAAFMVGIGVDGEENLRVDIDWQDAFDNDVVVNPADYPDLAGTDNTIDSNSQLIDFLAIDNGSYTFGHVYSVFDVNQIVNTTGGTATVRFGVSHHESINVFGSSIVQGGPAESVPGGLISQTAGTDPTDTLFSPGTAEFNFVNTPIPPVIENDPAPQPNPAPPNPEPVQLDVPLSLVAVEPDVASRVGVSSQSFDYFQLRRNEGEAGYVIIDEQISEDNGESLLDPRNLRQYVEDNNVPDEQDYELWLITTKVNNAGQSVTLERPILKFDISGGRPIPAIEDLPMEFPELRLEAIPLDGDAEVDPAENSDMNDADPKSETPDSPELPERLEEEQDTVSLMEGGDRLQRVDGSHQASAIGIGGVLAVSNLNRKKSSIEGRRVRNASLLSRIFGSKSSN